MNTYSGAFFLLLVLTMKPLEAGEGPNCYLDISSRVISIPLLYSDGKESVLYRGPYVGINIVSMRADDREIVPDEVGLRFDEIDLSAVKVSLPFIYNLTADSEPLLKKDGYWSFFTAKTQLPHWDSEVYRILTTTKTLEIRYRIFLPGHRVSAIHEMKISIDKGMY